MVNSLLQIGMNAVRAGKLTTGAKMSKTLNSGTVVDVVNKGKGILQKIVKKQNGDIFTSIFNNGKLEQVTARNSRGMYTIKPVLDDIAEFLHLPGEKMYNISGKINGPSSLSFDLTKVVNGSDAGNFNIAFDKGNYVYSEAGAKKLYDYLVKQAPNETINDLHKFTL